MSFERYMRDNLFLLRQTNTGEGDSGREYVENSEEIPFKGLIYQLNMEKTIMDDKSVFVSTHMLLTKYSGILKEKDRIKDDSGRLYEIKSINNPMQHHYEAGLKVIE